MAFFFFFFLSARIIVSYLCAMILTDSSSLGVDTEFCVITSSIPISPFSRGIRTRRLQGQAGKKKKMSIIHPVLPLTCHIYFLGGCIDNESLPPTLSAGETLCVLRGGEELRTHQMSSGDLLADLLLDTKNL